MYSPRMDRSSFVKLYEDLWSNGLWAAPWSKAVADLSPQQAAWKPAAERKSAWQIVSHVTFWRNYFLQKLKNPDMKMPEEEILRQQWAVPDQPTDAAWSDARKNLEASHTAIAAAMKEEASVDRIAPILGHDAYHLGQVMYLRALQGLKPID
jgi:hypothetical protein